MFDLFYFLTVLAVLVSGVAIFNFQPDFYTYDFRDELVIVWLGLELRKIASWRIRAVETVAFRLSVVSALNLKGASSQTRPINIVAITLKDNLVIAVTPRNVPEFCARVAASIPRRAG
ncbi:hypothetical protein ACFP9V_12695 [Deinococcus radiopugnans]|uniref:PH domain-containing protein n=1 Tax=Deinococcus radiopugnans ATCC 19172 TaxID=585398 RepID=A0A5C4Y476_9DEIO|nr:hypothetical protein [Deinococcus radiopugnans]MBB6017558.1 hypothetical protein [Deinococcus radiopugnans ATCC 19172]TNM69808.1 hypothetical protein FHR04_14630 [Deinococcus radiopugnans ATCC 19172]